MEEYDSGLGASMGRKYVEKYPKLKDLSLEEFAKHFNMKDFLECQDHADIMRLFKDITGQDIDSAIDEHIDEIFDDYNSNKISKAEMLDELSFLEK